MGLIEQDHRYSYSQLSSFDECPYSYYLSRIQKVPEVENAFSQYGTLMHSCIERWANGQIDKENLPQTWQKEYPKAVTYDWPKVLSSKGYAQKAFNQGYTYLKHFDGFDDYNILHAQYPCETRIADRRFVGIIDMLAQDKKTGQLVIIDHKSKSKAAFKKAANSMYRQLYIYSKFIKQQYGKFPDRLMFNLFKEQLYDSRKFSMEQYQNTIQWAEDTIFKIQNYDFVDFLQQKKADLFCTAICGVRDSCQNGHANVNRGSKT